MKTDDTKQAADGTAVTPIQGHCRFCRQWIATGLPAPQAFYCKRISEAALLHAVTFYPPADFGCVWFEPYGPAAA